LKKAHINWAWVTWSNGFSPATERGQQETLARYIELCHQNTFASPPISRWVTCSEDMFEKVPESIAWVDRLEDGSPFVFYTRPNRYMADIGHPGWLNLQRQRVEAAARAGADAFWIDNTFAYHGRER